jgi:hypothetical protein
MPYNCHTSNRLKDCFKKKPWQGDDPTKARFLFVGLDANFDANIENTLPEIFDYLDDGVGYWQGERVHHPFMRPDYRGNGRLYHDRFAKIGFTPEQAELVSFIELLPVPTTGRSDLRASDLLPEHLDHLCKLANWFDRGSAKYVFLPCSVVRFMRHPTLRDKFSWMPPPTPMDDGLKVLRNNGQIIYEMYHFACWGWQLPLLERQIAQIANLPR